MTPGEQTSEWKKSQRAEALGILLVVSGVLLCLVDAARIVAGISFVALGVILVAHTTAAYSRARGDIKAASVRRPVDLPRSL